MELYIPLNFSNTKAKKSWFNSVCSRAVNDREAPHKRYHSYPSAETRALYISACNHSRAVNDREAAHKWYHSHPSAETHALYISACNHAKSILQLTKLFHQ